MAVKGKAKQIAGKSPASSASSSGKRKSTRADGESSCAPPKKKRSGVSHFFDDAAVDADFEGDEEEDDLEWEIDDDFDLELPDIGAKVVMNVTKVPGQSCPLRVVIKEEELNDDELEEAIKERYRDSGFVSFDGDAKKCDESLLVAHATKDLSVWRVKCMMGRERQTAFCLMQKFVDLLKIGKKLQIVSVFALDHVKGFVYFEADKTCNVFEACNGLCILYSSRIELVPRNEVPNLLSIQKRACAISKGMWVRMKNGKYKGDLAEAVFVNDAKKRVTIKVVPRIDLQAIAKKFGGGQSLKAAAIPAPQLISSHELEDFRPHIEVRRDRETGEIFEVLDGLMLKDGYLYKKVSLGSLIYWGVQPSSNELAKFEDLGKDEARDVSWLSSIYKARMKQKLPETSHQKNGERYNQKNGEKYNQKSGEKSNQKEGEKQRNGFDIDDLVLFGKKDCGVIIDKENDTFKVLKGDVNGSEVVSINIRVIKKNCVDKVFTAADCCKKTISIDDVVTVSDGPLKGREGIVRHMYKGILFIYDECQSENNGFFCVKSEICELVKKSRDFRGGKLSSNAGPSFVQSPIRSSEQNENSQSFFRDRQSNSRGTFSVGQTLRICKGPLKGYLCRVIRMHRADVTVKLDSLGKLLTVDEKLLSCPNSKRDDVIAMQSDMFGFQEEQPTGGLLDAREGLRMDNFEFNAGTSSFGRDSWNTPSCSSFSFPGENDSKDQNQVADKWGTKLPSLNGDQELGASNSWSKAPSSSAEQSSWNKIESEEKGADSNCKNDADAWNMASIKGETSAAGWEIDTPVQKTSQTWSTKDASSGWDSAVHIAAEGVNDGGGWGKAKLLTPDSGDGRTLGGDSWNVAVSKPRTVSNTETRRWEQSKLACSSATGSWNTQGASADWNKETIGKDRTDGFGGQSGNWTSSKSRDGDNLDSWGINGNGLVGNNDDTWGKPAASQDTKPVANKPWQSSFNSSVQSKAWKTPSAEENQAADWGTSSLERASQTSSWEKVNEKSKAVAIEIEDWKRATDGNQTTGWAASAKNSGTSSVEDGSQSNSWKVNSLPSSSGWEKSKATVTETVRDWKTTKDSNQVTGWGSSAMPSATPSVEHENLTNNWDKVSISLSSSGWQISKQAGTTAKDGWNKDGFSSEGQINGWNKEKSSDCDQASGWNKTSNAEGGKDVWMDSCDKAKSSEGCGGGQESRGQWKARDDLHNDQRDPNFDKSKDSDLVQGSGWSQGKNWGRGNSWNQQRDFDGGRGSSRGRGRGRYGGRGGRNEDNFEKPGDSDEGWSLGRGGGRGRNGAGSYNRDNTDTREFGRGRGCGRGRGLGQDQGQFQSSGWRNGRERFDEGFSNKPSSSWGSHQGSYWNKSRGQHSAGEMDESVGWNSGNSFGSCDKPGWGTNPQDSGRSKNDMNENLTSSWSKGVNTGKQMDNWSKETRNNDNWNTPKTLDDKLSSWNQTSQSTDWMIKSTKSPNSPTVPLADGAHHHFHGSKVTTNDDQWTKAKSSPGGDHGDTLSGELNSNDRFKTSTLNKENEASDNQGWWSSKKMNTQVSQPSSETENNWGKWKEPCSGSSTAGRLESSKDWGDNKSTNLDSLSSAWDSKSEPTSSHGSWSGKDSTGNQSSESNCGGGCKLGNQSGYQGKSENWSRGSAFSRGGGGRGRHNSFSQGRSFGRNSSGRHSYNWSSNNDSGKQGDDGGQAFNSNQGFRTRGSWSRSHGTFEGQKGSWNSGGNAEKDSWSSCKFEEENRPADQAKQGSVWAASTSASASADDSCCVGSSKGSSDNNSSVNWDSHSSPWDSNKEPTSSQGNWAGKDSSGSHSSKRDDDDGSKWNRQSGTQGKSESCSRQSDFGRGGGRGRGNSFSSRDRSPGRNSSGDRGNAKGGNDGWQAFNSNQEFKTGGTWNNNNGGNAEKGSWGGGWKSDGQNQPAGRAKPGWEAESSKSSWASASAKEPVTTGKSSWDSPAGFGSNPASGWETDSSSDLATKTSHATDGGKQKNNNPWGSANAGKMEQGSARSNMKSTPNSGSSDEIQKQPSSETDRAGSRDANNASSKDGKSNKLGSWNEKGSDRSSEAGGSLLPPDEETPQWQSSWNDTVGEDRDESNSGNGGGNSGW